MSWLNETYPNWKATISAKFGEKDTIYYSDAENDTQEKGIDCKSETERNSKEQVVQRASTGRNATDKQIFLEEFRKLQLGGFLIEDFETQTFFEVR